MDKTFTTQSEVTLTLKPVSTMTIERVRAMARQRFEDEHGEIKPPTYETSVGETFEHDTDSIKDEHTSDDDKRAWLAYQGSLNTLLLETISAITEAYLFAGVTDNPDGDDWKATYQALDIEIPDDPKEFKLFWLDNEVLSNRSERTQLALYIKALADPVEVEAAQAAATFQHPVEET